MSVGSGRHFPQAPWLGRGSCRPEDRSRIVLAGRGAGPTWHASLTPTPAWLPTQPTRHASTAETPAQITTAFGVESIDSRRLSAILPVVSRTRFAVEDDEPDVA